jgi:hypothetical protein
MEHNMHPGAIYVYDLNIHKWKLHASITKYCNWEEEIEPAEFVFNSSWVVRYLQIDSRTSLSNDEAILKQAIIDAI